MGTSAGMCANARVLLQSVLYVASGKPGSGAFAYQGNTASHSCLHVLTLISSINPVEVGGNSGRWWVTRMLKIQNLKSGCD